jgi:hypothetical protein
MALKCKIETVNIIEYLDGTIASVVAFSDTPTGNKEAERLFVACAKENKFSKKEIETGLEDGYLDHSDSDYRLFICHSM